MDTAGRYVVAALLVVLATVEFLCRIALIAAICASIIGMMFVAIMLEPDMEEVTDFLAPASLGLVKSLLITPPGQLTSRQLRQLEFDRQHNVILAETLRLEQALNVGHAAPEL